ncbi:MAG: DUF4388 domain-containing protein, partial [Nitrospira sp.]|nr:DUF4388 domain-containing protein [Nitrospira sp.]
MMEIPLKGNLRDFSLPRMLIFLNGNKKTGTVIVKTADFIKKMYLNQGEAIFSSSTDESDRLGEMLVRAGKITREEYDRSVEEILKKTGKRQGTILVELGYVTPKQLFWG